MAKYLVLVRYSLNYNSNWEHFMEIEDGAAVNCLSPVITY